MNFCRSIIIAELWRLEVARRWKNVNFCVFFGKNDPLLLNIKSSVQKGFIATLIDVLCPNFVQFGRREIGKIVWQKNKISPGSPSLAIAPIPSKIYHSQPHTMYSECSRFHPNRFTFGGVISERVNTDTARSYVNPIFGWSLASSRIITVTRRILNTKKVIVLTATTFRGLSSSPVTCFKHACSM